ncbi:MAG: arylsulfatase [Bacteroidota bacterium]|nr:arylsulfatase [Bacteroidota bacterium]
MKNLIFLILTITSVNVFGLKLPIKKKPNVIIIMTDDQGYPELSMHGNPILKTPNLDELGKSSVQFKNFHVTPMCAPTRGELLTGLDNAVNQLSNVSSGRALLKSGIPTMGNIFASNGYSTGIFGKWHMGSNYPYRPQDRGFEESVWFPSSHIGSVSDFWGNDYFDDTYWHNGKKQKYEGYCTDIFFSESKRFIEESIDREKPFFAYISTNTPHGPLYPKEEDYKVLEKLFDKSELAGEKGLKSRLVKYLAMIRNIDSNIGDLTDFLDDKGVIDDTIIIFLTDNGSTMGKSYFNAGMRGMKTELWEGGHRVPLFIKWGNGNFKNTGKEVEGLCKVTDILPTLVELCGLNVTNKSSLKGLSLASILYGKEEISKDRKLIINYSRMPNFISYPIPHGQTILKKDGAVVLWKGWRLLESRELYNLENDPKQQLNIYDKNPAIVKILENELDQWWDSVKDDANEVQRIIIGSAYENPTTLTAIDWLDVFVDQQQQISLGARKNSYWCLEVEEVGEYEIELRRWPRETDATITGVPTTLGGRKVKTYPLPIKQASIYIGGVELRSISEKNPYGFEGLTKNVNSEDKFIKFNVNLKKGPIYLHTFFHLDEGSDKKASDQNLIGAYYVYINKI